MEPNFTQSERLYDQIRTFGKSSRPYLHCGSCNQAIGKNLKRHNATCTNLKPFCTLIVDGDLIAKDYAEFKKEKWRVRVEDIVTIIHGTTTVKVPMNNSLRDIIIDNQTTQPTVDDVTTNKLTRSTLVTDNGSGYES